MKKYGAPSVKKAFAILSAISSSRQGLGVSELAKNLKMAKSTVHGMTSALEELGAVMRDPLTKKYKLGFTLLEIGRSAYAQIDLKTSARPVMEELMEKTQTSVFLGILNWDHPQSAPPYPCWPAPWAKFFWLPWMTHRCAKLLNPEDCPALRAIQSLMRRYISRS
jgi:DNA-binding MarR family transcriptional regulator